MAALMSAMVRKAWDMQLMYCTTGNLAEAATRVIGFKTFSVWHVCRQCPLHRSVLGKALPQHYCQQQCTELQNANVRCKPYATIPAHLSSASSTPHQLF